MVNQAVSLRGDEVVSRQMSGWLKERARCLRALLELGLALGIALAVSFQPAHAQSSGGIIELQNQAISGDPVAMGRYGRALALGENISKNQEQALDWLRRAAERGNVQGMYWFATMLFGGEGGPVNQPLAVSWLKRASENGHLSSMFLLAQALANGQGTERDPALAYTWISIVATAEPLQKTSNATLLDFKKRADSFRETLSKSLSPTQRIEADQQAAQWTAGSSPTISTKSTPGGSSATGSNPANTAQSSAGQAPPAGPQSTLSGGQTFGLPPAPMPVPGTDNPLNQRPSTINPLRPRSEAPSAPGNAGAGTGASGGVNAGVNAGVNTSPNTSVSSNASGLRRLSSASGFFVTIQGTIITNHHVVKNCKQIRIVDGAEVKLMAYDAKEDIALLVGPPLNKAVNFRAVDRISQGEEVLAYGFPLQTVLASSGQIGAGLVSATSGLRNNPSQMQIDVPLQTGNSGGPLLDRNGDLVGMTVSKLNTLQVAQTTGDVPQNVNFAVKHTVIKKFLDLHRQQYRVGSNKSKLDAKTIADEARTYTIALECMG